MVNAHSSEYAKHYKIRKYLLKYVAQHIRISDYTLFFGQIN